MIWGYHYFRKHPHGSPQNQPPLQKGQFTSGTPYHFSGFPCLANFVSGNFPPNKGTSVFFGSVLLATKNRRFSKAQGAATGLIPEIVFSKGVERKQNSDAHKSHSIHRTGLFTLQFPIKINHIMFLV